VQPGWTDSTSSKPPRPYARAGPKSAKSCWQAGTGPVRYARVMIPKPDGSQRELGIPTVLDRLIQQALLQVLQPLIDPTFSEHSHGFRPGRRAHDAVKAARKYVQSGKRVVVDVDLAKFFDRVNHDILIDRLRKRIDDAGVIRLIRAYLNAGIMDGGVVSERHMGTPQGGPLSPLLANVLLDEVDKALEARGYSFARYADDCNVYVGSIKAGERVMALLRKLYAGSSFKSTKPRVRWQRLRAQVPGLCAVGGQGPRGQMCKWPTSRWTTSRPASGNSHAARAGAAWSKWCRNCGPTCWAGRRTSGWRKRQRSGESWTSGCATACGPSSSSTGSGPATIYRELKALGAKENVAKQGGGELRAGGATATGCSTGADHCVLRLSGSTPTLMTSSSRTARCGPACRVVWQGRLL
jgi:RNA-directed DNA polymerase